MAFELTDKQKEVVFDRGKNLLVSAAAGSGKTAVLVERILNIITDDKNPVNIDRFLIVTFTKAAASEMKEKILNAIYDKLEENPDNENLILQSKLINFAQICTIDSFCSRLVKEHFSLINISSEFVPGSEDELKSLFDEVLESLFNKHFEEKDKEFIRLCDTFVYRHSLKNLKDMIRSLYNHAQSYPWPKEWLEALCHTYEINSPEEIEESPWYLENLNQIKHSLKDIEKDYIRIRGYVESNLNEEEKNHPYYDTILYESEYVKAIVSEEENWDRLLLDMSFETLSRAKLPGEDKQCREYVRDARNKLKDEIKEYQNYIIPDKMAVFQEMNEMAPIIKTLIDFVLEFSESFMEEKRRINKFSFNDIEHFALCVLRDEKTHEVSQTGEDLKKIYDYIMVDEYQDSNLLQENILTAIVSEKKNNYFMVGDVKQSIYRFRKAKPSIFTEKYNLYKKDGKNNKAIDLSKNFRSRQNVIRFVNMIFQEIMHEDIGGVEYDDGVSLKFGADYYGDNKVDYDAELIMTSSIEEGFLENNISAREAEARLIAKEIKRLYGMPIRDGEIVRPATYKDFVILHRSANKITNIYMDTLRNEGIPVKSTGAKGYYSSFEIESVLGMLSLINNRYDDINLVNVLKNFYGFSKNDLAKVRAENKKEGFYSKAFFEYAKDCRDEKVRAFYESFTKLRDSMSGKRIYEVIGKVLGINSFKEKLYAMPDGTLRIANIEKLTDLAVNYERNSSGDLSDFIAYIKDMIKYDIDLPVSGIFEEDCVRIMTIHKSKGLEFPICFISGLSEALRKNNTENGMALTDNYGVGFDYINKDLFVKRPSIHKKILSSFENIENVAEIQRLLYVALTRAKEKLILTAVLDTDVREYIDKTNQDIDRRIRIKSSNYLSLILPTMLKNNCEIKIVSADELLADSVLGIAKQKANSEGLLLLENKADLKLLEEIKESIEYSYPITGHTRLKNKYSVSEIKRKNSSVFEPEEELFNDIERKRRIPKFAAEYKSEKNKGAIRGTAFHRFMECVEFGEDVDLNKELDRIVAKGLMSSEEAGFLDMLQIEKFFESDLAKRMINAQKRKELFKEKTFVCSVESKKLFPEIEFSKSEENDTTLIQGIIDAYFIEDGKIILLDYKTDKVNNEEELKSRYKTQLDLYADALINATNMEVSELILYSFNLNCEIRL